MDALEAYQWPGNVRELRNVIERAVYRWGTWEAPVAHIVFDPFDSPWKPAAMPRVDSAPTERPAGVPARSTAMKRPFWKARWPATASTSVRPPRH